jgi:hypothetical protein
MLGVSGVLIHRYLCQVHRLIHRYVRQAYRLIYRYVRILGVAGGTPGAYAGRMAGVYARGACQPAARAYVAYARAPGL